MKISKLFYVLSSSSLDYNKMIPCNQNDKNTVNFVSRSSKNLGVIGKVKRINGKEPFPSSLITVTLGGTYLLSCFVQQEPFYTAEHMRVLKPRSDMSMQEKLYYCLCITKNRFRYSAFGREADRTIQDLELPNKIPNWVYSKELLQSIREKMTSNL